jgi:hypothetical protein
MKVYRFAASTDDKWRSVIVNARDYDTWDAFGTTPLSATWKPLVVRTLDEDQDDEMDEGQTRNYRDRPIPDFPLNFGCHNVVSRRAAEALADVLRSDGEVLPITCSFGDYCAINVLKVIDAVDVDRSVVRRFKYPPYRVWEINRYAWRQEMLANAVIFRLPLSQYKIYCTEPVVQRIRDAGLTGFRDAPLPTVD